MEYTDDDLNRMRSAIAWAEHFHKPKEILAALWVRYTQMLNGEEATP